MDAMASPSLVWFRDDLRLADNPALRAATDRGEPVVAVFVLDEVSPGIRPLGGAARWWLHHSLAELGERLCEKGSVLVLRRGAAAEVVPALAREIGAGAVFWNRRYGGPERTVDAAIKEELRADGVEGVVRRLPAVRAVDRAHRRRHPVRGLHPVLERVPAVARAARSPARAAHAGRTGVSAGIR